MSGPTEEGDDLTTEELEQLEALVDDVFEDPEPDTFVKRVGPLRLFRLSYNGAVGISVCADDEDQDSPTAAYLWAGAWTWGIELAKCPCHRLAVYVGPFGLEVS